MPAFAFHHLTVQTRSALPADPGALLLAGFPPAEDWRRPAITIAFEAATAPFPALTGQPFFTHGDISVHLEGGVPVVAGPASRLRVSERGDRIDGWLEPSAAALPREVAEGELMVALTLALRSHGLVHLHAAATMSPAGQVLLIAGTGGSGKSTLTAALVAAGHAYLGDDVVLVAPGGVLFAFPRPFHLSPASARAVGVEAGSPRPATGKGDVDASAAFPGRFRWFAQTPDRILLPRIAGRPTSALEPATRTGALGALLSLSAFAASKLPGAAEQRGRLAAVVDGARPMNVALGRDLLDDAAGTAARLDAELGAAIPPGPGA
jgi:hypothetical protein